MSLNDTFCLMYDWYMARLSKKRKDWRSVHRNIGTAFTSYYRASKKSPTYDDLARMVGVSRRTIVRHMQDIDFDGLLYRQRQEVSSLAPNALMAIYNSAIHGSPKSQKIMLQLIFGWSKPKSFDLATPQSNDRMFGSDQNIDDELRILLEMYRKKKSSD